ncbi:MAG: ATP-grasp domain-containing protein [Planctomycetota bacterium]|jgi:glutathione synthase/RimK-type ligase-like ATP-grasp enzyme
MGAESDRPLPFAVELALEAADRLGWPTRVIDPEYGYLWELELPDGTRRALVGMKTPINDGAASQLSSDKHYSGLVLSEHGIRVPDGERALSPRHFAGTGYAERTRLDGVHAFAEARGFPLIVKPNRMSHGRLVRRVSDMRELEEAVRAVWELDRLALIQVVVPGRELRLDLLDGEFLAGYERRPHRLTGDGQRTMRELLIALDSRFASDLALERAAADGLEATRVLERDESVELGNGILNLNRSATGVLIPDLPPRWLAWGRRVADAIGLRLAGIDLRIDCEGDPLDADPERAVVIEVNGTPLLTQIARLGHRELALDAQARILSALAD